MGCPVLSNNFPLMRRMQDRLLLHILFTIHVDFKWRALSGRFRSSHIKRVDLYSLDASVKW